MISSYKACRPGKVGLEYCKGLELKRREGKNSNRGRRKRNWGELSERLRGRIQSRKIGKELRSCRTRATTAVRSAGLGLPAPWVTPPWREGAWPLIASRDCRTSCPPEERVSLGSRLLLTGGFRLSSESPGCLVQEGLGERCL